jgi:tripartite-type tricarboxylate transporter receptor subunit TctC
MLLMLKRFIAPPLVLVAVLPLLLQEATGQAYPTKPIRIIVPTPPGGPADVLARALSSKLKDAVGVPLLVENKPGGAQMIGANAVAKATPDGYTLLLANDGPITINPHFYADMAYNPKTDLAPVTMIVEAPIVLVVHPSVKAGSVAELISLAKADPDTLNFASGGNTSRLAGELFRLNTGAQIVNVSYNGSGKAIAAVVGGEAQMMFDGVSSALPFVRSGALRALGVGTPKPLAELPDSSPIADTVAGYSAASWLGIFAPAGTAPEILAFQQREFAAAVREPALHSWLINLGMYPVANSSTEFASFLETDAAKWGRVIRDAKIQRPD